MAAIWRWSASVAIGHYIDYQESILWVRSLCLVQFNRKASSHQMFQVVFLSSISHCVASTNASRVRVTRKGRSEKSVSTAPGFPRTMSTTNSLSIPPFHPDAFTFIYKHVDGIALSVDVYRPYMFEEPKPTGPQISVAEGPGMLQVPAVVYFHGGGLTVGNKASWFPAWLQSA